MTPKEIDDKLRALSSILTRLQTMLLLFDPEVVEASIAVRKIAHYDVSDEDAAVFLRWHTFVTNPQPDYITAWRAVPKDEQRWYRWHMSGISDARSALAAAHYHSSRLLELES
jgi:hypothetical protein